jgi:hypothetical protein
VNLPRSRVEISASEGKSAAPEADQPPGVQVSAPLTNTIPPRPSPLAREAQMEAMSQINVATGPDFKKQVH